MPRPCWIGPSNSATARLDGQSARLAAGLGANAAAHERRLLRVAGRLSLDPIHRAWISVPRAWRASRLRLERPLPQALERAESRLAALARALTTLDPKRPKPGFARVDDETGAMVASAADLSPGQAVRLVFPDGTRAARIEGDSAVRARPAPRPKPTAVAQGDLF